MSDRGFLGQLFACNAHILDEYIGGAERSFAARNAEFDFIGKCCDGAEKLEEVARDGEGFDGVCLFEIGRAHI